MKYKGKYVNLAGRKFKLSLHFLSFFICYFSACRKSYEIHAREIGEEGLKLHKQNFPGWDFCNLCNFFGTELQHLEQHKWTKHGIGGNHCRLCDFMGDNVKQHMLKVS